MEKKIYTTPELTVHGDVEKITLQGGATSTDMPQGTPVGPAGVSSVAS